MTVFFKFYLTRVIVYAIYDIMISSQKVIKKHNISYQTLNYYTNLGLLTVRKRKGNGRLYNEQEVDRNLKRISQLKDQGYPLRLICKML
ncbi:MAG: MerR family transcriptional regulator [Candidatus Omnitrophota bacterium]|nr:MerR family transcriptional regulator [Candidatus Omnitrophota bacterium]